MQNEKYISTRKEPFNLVPKDVLLFEHEYIKEIHGSNLRRLGKVWLLSDTIFKLSKLKVYDELTHSSELGKFAKLKRVFRFYAHTRKVNKAIWISDTWSHNYFHWITESLTRLISLDGEFSDYTIVLPEHLSSFNYIQDSLTYFDYPYTFLKKDEVIFTKDLISFDKVAPSFHFHATPLNMLREHFRKNQANEKPKRKIYISRQKSPKRRITNEDEVEKMAVNHGFEIHYFENYNFHQQLELMKDCSILMSIHGAGLTNMLFMKEGSSVIELRFTNDGLNNCYFIMASELKFNYYYIQNDFEIEKLHLNSNMIANLPQIQSLLESLEKKF